MPIIRVISGSVYIDWFFSLFWAVFAFLFACLMILYWTMDIVNFTFLDADFLSFLNVVFILGCC